ncbi:hypothetical protein EV356DRAFT_526676 [Viridothelium virens]|uniref:CENP-V/GFA domain-containing protein n=1 Tax=Viridothelium virens TaxID=1048519 RepID=A0A6A6HJ63_VIRVR|nr:hypothetical protein EV356DRAFT_526676 [Viridothelium virens]
MPSGTCACGKVKISYEGEPKAKALCHCADCKKITGSTYSTNVLVPDDDFKVVSGSPKEWAKKADGGNTITSHFCGDCGTTLWRDGATFPGIKIIKYGTMDDSESIEFAKPAMELYASQRASWVPEIPGSQQLSGMPS